MKLVNQYIIPFKGLKEGEHEFTFDFDKKFFDKHEVLEAQGGQVQALIVLFKRPHLLSLKYKLDGFIEIQCDRCLEYFNLPISYKGTLFIKFSENEAESTDEIWIISPNDSELDLEQYFFECLALSLPLQKVHSNDSSGEPGCNTEMLCRIENQNKTSDRDGYDIDPRWNKLKDLLNDN